MELRSVLAEMTENYGREHHPAMIARLGSTIGHTISLGGVGDDREALYNCVSFATGLQPTSRAYQLVQDTVAVAQHLRPTWPNRFFANMAYLQFLMAQEPRTPAAVGIPSWAIYSSNDRPTHIGRVIDEGRVESKWGTGHVWQHGIWEVPTTYGNKIELIEAIAVDNCERHFFAFAALDRDYELVCKVAQEFGTAWNIVTKQAGDGVA